MGTDFDLNNPAVLLSDIVVADPSGFYDQLRTECPVWQVPGHPVFLVVDPHLVREAVARTSDFSSNLVQLVHKGPDGCPVVVPFLPKGDPSQVLAIADPPEHAKQRKLLQPHLSASAVNERTADLRGLATRLLAPLVAAGGGDVVPTFCDLLPALAICQLVGFPEDDAEMFITKVAEVGLILDGVTDETGLGIAAGAALELTLYATEQLQSALDGTGGDGLLMRVLVGAIADGELTFDGAAGILMQLITAGTETTTSLIARAVSTLCQHPATQQELREHPDRIPTFIEEVLRRSGPFQYHFRWAPEDTTLGDAVIPGGSSVLMMWAAADRDDPSSPELPERFALDGQAPPHLAFGRGLHFCIGANLARLEARVALEELLSRTTAIELDPSAPITERPSVSIKRLTSVPVLMR